VFLAYFFIMVFYYVHSFLYFFSVVGFLSVDDGDLFDFAFQDS
jgi:hypothetical protein